MNESKRTNVLRFLFSEFEYSQLSNAAYDMGLDFSSLIRLFLNASFKNISILSPQFTDDDNSEKVPIQITLNDKEYSNLNKISKGINFNSSQFVRFVLSNVSGIGVLFKNGSIDMIFNESIIAENNNIEENVELQEINNLILKNVKNTTEAKNVNFDRGSIKAIEDYTHEYENNQKRKRGRPKKETKENIEPVEQVAQINKKRGRPKKEEIKKDDLIKPETEYLEPEPETKKRGRPKKAQSVLTPKATTEATRETKKRGRPKKEEIVVPPAPTKKQRGRPRKQ